MADNTTLNAGTGGDVIATDDIAGVKHQQVKVEFGADGVATPVSALNPLPVDGSGVTQPVSNAGLTALNGAIAGTEVQVDVLTLPAVTIAGAQTLATVTTVGAVTAITNALPAGTAYIGKTRLTDGTTDAEVVPLAGYNAQAVAIVDGSGAQITSFGGGTQYTEADTDASITGTAMLMEGAANTLLPVQGTVADGLLVNLGTNNDVTVTGSVTANLAAGTNNIGDVDILSIAAGDNNIGNVDVVTLPALPAGTNNIGDVDVLTVPAPLSTTGGGTEATALRVTIATDSTGVLSVDDNGGALTVDNGGTFVVQESGAALTALQLIDDAIHASDAALGKSMAIGAVLDDAATVAITENQAGYLRMSSRRALLVEGVASGTAISTNWAGTSPPIGAGTEATALRVTLATDSTGLVSVDDNGASLSVDWNGTQPVTGSGTATGALRVELPTNGTGIVGLAAGTNAIGKLAANSGIDIGDVDILSIAAGTNYIGRVRLTDGTLNSSLVDETGVSAVDALAVGGGTPHDSADSGNSVKVGAKAITSLKTTTLVASADRADNQADLDGALLVRGQFPLGDLISERVADTSGTSTAFTNFSNVASTRNFVTAVSAFNSSASACYLDIRDGTAGSVLYTLYLPAGGGCVISGGGVPLFRSTANTALAYDVSAAVTTVYINMTGFQSKL